MKTRITELFGIKYPVILSGMTGISNPELVAAVSNAGGLGILAIGGLNADETLSAIREVRQRTNKPFGANVPLIFPGVEKKADILLQEKVGVINYSLGKGDKLTQAAHAYGGKVIATVVTQKHALAAQRDGTDALIVTGHEAAAHGGEVTSLVLTPSIVDAVAIPVIAAGGFADGRGLAAALTLGADAIAMGTRFMNTIESPAHSNMKTVGIEKTCYDTIYTDRIDGLPCRAMKSKGVDRLMKSKFYLLKALYSSREASRAFGFPWMQMLGGILLAGYQKSKQLARMANSYKPIQYSMVEGDIDKGVFLMGQVTGMVQNTPSVAELMDELILEAKNTIKKMPILI